jgi:hypothetical protein
MGKSLEPQTECVTDTLFQLLISVPFNRRCNLVTFHILEYALF